MSDEVTPLDLLDSLKSATADDQLRAIAIRLGDEGVQESVPALLELLKTHPSRAVRDGAAIGLRELRAQEALAPIVQAIQDDPTHCGSLVYALQTLDCQSVLDFLIELAATGPYEVRCGVAGCLENIDINALPGEKKQAFARKLAESAARTTSEADREQLEWLAELFG